MLPSSHVFFSWFHSIIINCYSVSKTKHADLLLASLSDTYLWIILWTTSLVPEWIDVRFNCFCCAFSVLWWADFLTSLFQPIKARLTVRLAVPAHAFPPLAPVHLFSEKHDWIHCLIVCALREWLQKLLHFCFYHRQQSVETRI